VDVCVDALAGAGDDDGIAEPPETFSLSAPPSTSCPASETCVQNWKVMSAGAVTVAAPA
jgi:hypothetical protein